MSSQAIYWLTSLGLIVLANGAANLGDSRWLAPIMVGLGATAVGFAAKGIARKLERRP